MGKEFTQDHIMKICLPPELYLAITKFQAEKEIGKPYAGLLLLTKAIYQEQLITKEVYEKYLYRYSRKLIPEEQTQKLTAEQQKNKQRLDEKARSFTAAYNQWDIHLDNKWRQYWVNEAKQWQNLMPEAKTFLQKVQEKHFTK
jgi:hypothetical protein